MIRQLRLGWGPGLVQPLVLRPIARIHDFVASWRPPIRRREFWAVQGLVLCIAIAHVAVEVAHLLPETGTTYLVPVTLYFVPVVYAAVNFGLHGSGPTAIWCAVLAIPNLVLWHQGMQQFGELWQTATVVAIGIFVGNRVDRETGARRVAEEGARAHRAAEEKYRGVFDHVADAILLIDESGRVAEANAAASRLLGRPSASLSGLPVAELLPPDLAAIAAGGAAPRVSRVGSGEAARWVEPVAERFEDPAGRPGIQMVLRDVTLRYLRERELEDYTRQTLAAREGERHKIARDLHDGPVQELVLLVRRLDRVAEFTRPEGSEPLAAARDVAKTVAAELRRFSRELRPSILDDLGLAAAIKAEAETFGQRSGLPVEVEATSAGRRLEPEIELTFLRIEQEALNNVARHANASRVRVRLACGSRSARMTIEDDGCGLERLPAAHELLDQGKMGLVGMQERARLVGGALKIGRSKLGGTQVALVCRA